MVIARADDLTAADPTAGHHHAPDGRPVVAAARSIDPRGTAEFTGGHHQRGFQPAGFLQVVQQDREGSIECRAASRGRNRPTC